MIDRGRRATWLPGQGQGVDDGTSTPDELGTVPTTGQDIEEAPRGLDGVV